MSVNRNLFCPWKLRFFFSIQGLKLYNIFLQGFYIGIGIQAYGGIQDGAAIQITVRGLTSVPPPARPMRKGALLL